MELSECDRIYRTKWKRPHSRTLLVILFVTGALGMYVFLNPELTTPPGMEPGPSSYMPLLFFLGWILLMAVFPIWWLMTENYGRVGVSENGLVVSEEDAPDIFVGWDEITQLRWATLGVTEPVAHSYIMQVTAAEGDLVEIGFAHRRQPHRDMIRLREWIIERLDLQETQVRPGAWFEDGDLQVAGSENLRKWAPAGADETQ